MSANDSGCFALLQTVALGVSTEKVQKLWVFQLRVKLQVVEVDLVSLIGRDSLGGCLKLIGVANEGLLKVAHDFLPEEKGKDTIKKMLTKIPIQLDKYLMVFFMLRCLSMVLTSLSVIVLLYCNPEAFPFFRLRRKPL